MRETVHCIGHSPSKPDDVWAVVADFGIAWHPSVEWDLREKPKNGQVIRRFAMVGSDVIMRERLTYFSQSDKTMSYTMLDGIEGVQAYNARLNIAGSDTGSVITWNAELGATAIRATDIAHSTKDIFEVGLQALKSAKPPTGFARVMPKPSEIGNVVLGDVPRLALSVAPEGLKTTKTLCLFLHGIGGGRSNWDDQLRALGGIMPMAALDLRGYGNSTLGFSPSHIDDYIEDVKNIMARFGAQKVILCGLSYGSWIATSIALRHPEMIAGLVLCGGCTGMSEAAPDEREAFRISREVPLQAGHSPADFAPDVVNVIAGPNASSAVLKSLSESMAAISPETYRDALNCFCNPLERFDFGKATFPILLMTGEFDQLAPRDEIRAVSHRFADAGAPYVRFEIIKNAGHVCNLEQPMTVNAHLFDFFDMIAPAKEISSKVARKTEKHDRILAAALREFSKNGYSGASMQAIAQRAEISKPTLYRYIGHKEDVFRAVLDLGRATILAPLDSAKDKDLVSVLWGFSWGYADYVLHPDNLSIARLIIGEAERMPEIAQQYHENGPGRALRGIADYLTIQQVKGNLEFTQADLTAEDLWSLILSGPRNHALHFPLDLPKKSQVRRSIVNGLKVFIRAYSSHPEKNLETLADLSKQ